MVAEQEDDEGDLGASELTTDGDESELDFAKKCARRRRAMPDDEETMVQASSVGEGDEGGQGLWLLLLVTKKTVDDNRDRWILGRWRQIQPAPSISG